MQRKSLKNIVKVTQKQQHVVVSGIGGVQGPQGIPGEAATITVGTTSTLPAGSSATVTNTGTTSAAVFDFGIPKGEKGQQGDKGESATIAVGSTSTLPAGSSATVTNTGTTSAAVFNFGIPKGDKGDKGDAGAGLQINGTVATYADLPNDLGPDDAGEAYFVQADGKLYVWTGTAFPPDGQGTQFEGPQGPSGTIAVGTTSTLPAGSSATVTNTGTSTSAVFNFGIPKGDKGDKGDPGDPGLSGTVGGPLNPVYLNNGVITAANTQSSGNNYSIVPKVSSDGVMDIGRYIDLHNSASGATDYTTRIEANADGNLYIQGGASPDVSVGTGISIRGANTKIGDLTSLATSSKNTLVDAINEVDGALSNVTYIGSTVGQATQLIDNEQNNIYPVAGSMISDSITTAMIQDEAITAAKLDPDLSTYSTTEKAVGTWIDGKTVYEKTLSRTIATSDIPSTNEVFLNTSTSNISVISVESVINYTSTSDNKKRAILLQRINPGNLSESYGLYYSEGGGTPSFRLQVPSTGRPQTTLTWHVIFRYTKD